jgi:predicted 2-oxoglutarate/Fe(II)-dependent dioxygenase YbiX
VYQGLLDLSQPLVWTRRDVLAPDECAALVERIEAAGCAPASIVTAAGDVVAPSIRNNERLMVDDPALAATLFARVRDAVPARMSGRERAGLNERLRFYRYGRGQRFAPHYDGFFERGAERSLLTVLVYLNDDFDGGATAFPELSRTVVPRTGMALFFQHHLLHEGCPVERGRKYVLRSDVMFRQAPFLCDDSSDGGPDGAEAGVGAGVADAAVLGGGVAAVGGAARS